MEQASGGSVMRIGEFTRDYIAKTFLHCKTNPAELLRLLVFVNPLSGMMILAPWCLPLSSESGLW